MPEIPPFDLDVFLAKLNDTISGYYRGGQMLNILILMGRKDPVTGARKPPEARVQFHGATAYYPL